MPAHNEAASIAATLREIHAAVSPQASMRFLVCEDGSTDGTVAELRRLAAELPIRLFSAPQRKGYSRAIIDGFRQVEAPFVFVLDADGQTDPSGFSGAWALRTDYDVVLGRRIRRADPPHRQAMSRAFRTMYRLLLRVPFDDPSCPFLVIRRDALRSVMGNLGVLEQGFWWEFVAHVHAAGFRIGEVSIHHRPRAAGKTHVYRLRRLPGIAWSHLLGLLQIRRQLHRVHTPDVPLEVDSSRHAT